MHAQRAMLMEEPNAIEFAVFQCGALANHKELAEPGSILHVARVAHRPMLAGVSRKLVGAFGIKPGKCAREQFGNFRSSFFQKGTRLSFDVACVECHEGRPIALRDADLRSETGGVGIEALTERFVYQQSCERGCE